MSLSTLAVFLVLTFAVAAFGAAFPPGEWYAALRKPPGTPPDAVFGPVWALLYLGIAVAGALAWSASHSPAVLAPWGAQLALNALWSWLFFGLHRPDLALAEIALLWLAIAVTTAVFWRVRPLAGALLVPYLLWVGYAAYLNAGLMRQNPA